MNFDVQFGCCFRSLLLMENLQAFRTTTTSEEYFQRKVECWESGVRNQGKQINEKGLITKDAIGEGVWHHGAAAVPCFSRCALRNNDLPDFSVYFGRMLKQAVCHPTTTACKVSDRSISKNRRQMKTKMRKWNAQCRWMEETCGSLAQIAGPWWELSLHICLTTTESSATCAWMHTHLRTRWQETCLLLLQKMADGNHKEYGRDLEVQKTNKRQRRGD